MCCSGPWISGLANQKCWERGINESKSTKQTLGVTRPTYQKLCFLKGCKGYKHHISLIIQKYFFKKKHENGTTYQFGYQRLLDSFTLKESIERCSY